MSTEITDAKQLYAAKRLHVFAGTRRSAKVLPDMESAFTISEDGHDDAYFVRKGQAIWVDVATDSTFYVTLEDQMVQLTFIVLGGSVLVAKKRLPYGGASKIGARPTHRPSYSSASS